MSVKKYIFIVLVVMISLSGCGKKTSQEVQLEQINKCFSNIDFVNCSRIDFISYQWDENESEYDRNRYSCLCKHEDLNTIFCKKYDFYESVYRVYTSVSKLNGYYTYMQVDLEEKDITQEGKSHYLQISLDEPITVMLGEKKFEEIWKILYNAENGDLWLSDSNENYSFFATLSEEKKIFLTDYEMIEFIEGKWERPPYNTILEAIDYMINEELTKGY